MLKEFVYNGLSLVLHSSWGAYLLPVLALMAWRLWRFTIIPRLRPNEPKELSYWIPFLGHTVDFLRSSDKLIERGLASTDRPHEPFAIQTLDRKLYIVTDPKDVSDVLKNTASLGFDGYLHELLVCFGFTPEAIKKIWHRPTVEDKTCHLNPDRLNFIHLAEDIFRRQLLPGEKMIKVRTDVLSTLDYSLHTSRMEFCTLESTLHGRKMSLYHLCRVVMVEAATRSLFGSHLHEIDPNIVQHMLLFGDHAWQVIFRLPTFLGLKATEPRKRLMDALRVFVKLPEHQRPEQAWAIQGVLEASDSFGIDYESRASVLLLMYWAANANEHNISFWVLAHILYDDQLHDAVKRETQAAWASGNLDIQSLSTNSPVLEAVTNEALRRYGGAVLSRKVLEPTIVGGKNLRPQNAVIIPSRQLHMNSEVWGSDSRDFDHTRFLKAKSLDRHPAFRPFGGGVTYCPGRILAKQQVYGLVAILFHRFDVRLSRGENEMKPAFPDLDDTTPRLGIADPAQGSDVFIEMRDL